MIYVTKKDTLAHLRAAIEAGDGPVTIKQHYARALYVTLKASTDDLIGIEEEGPVEKRRAKRKDAGVGRGKQVGDVLRNDRGDVVGKVASVESATPQKEVEGKLL